MGAGRSAGLGVGGAGFGLTDVEAGAGEVGGVSDTVGFAVALDTTDEFELVPDGGLGAVAGDATFESREDDFHRLLFFLLAPQAADLGLGVLEVMLEGREAVLEVRDLVFLDRVGAAEGLQFQVRRRQVTLRANLGRLDLRRTGRVRVRVRVRVMRVMRFYIYLLYM